VTVDQLGPTFISYRQSDGSQIATSSAWALRAAGMPVWQDHDDLPPGETEGLLGIAIDEGLSGGLIVITPDIEKSTVVRGTELPRLLRLADTNIDAFTLMVASVVTEPTTGRLDYDAPDRLTGRPLGTLRRFDIRSAGTHKASSELAMRMTRLRLGRLIGHIEEIGFLQIDVQTRVAPTASSVRAPLVLRVRPPAAGERLPNPHGLLDLAASLAHFPDVVANSVSRVGGLPVRFTGGAHLSVATALGLALPRTLLSAVEVQDLDGAIWKGGNPAEDDRSAIRLCGHGNGQPRRAERPEVACYVDLIPQASDTAYARFLQKNPALAAWRHLRPSAEGALDPAGCGPLVAAIAAHVRELSADAGSARVHLLLRAPWGVALLLGRQLNTLDVTMYEWAGPGSDEYHAVLRAQDGGRSIAVLEHRVDPL
jgi:SMODS-associated and fused to various effectors sensor domain